MANYLGTVASSGGQIKKGMQAQLQEYLDKWGNSGGDVDFKISKNTLYIYGYDDFDLHTYATKEDKENHIDIGDLDYEDGLGPNEFLGGLTKFLEPKGLIPEQYLIVVQTVGSEKCRFPLGAAEYILRPSGKVDCNCFKW